MSKLDQLFPEHIRSMGKYVPGKSARQSEAETGIQAIKMASNENPFGPSRLALEAIRQAALEGNLYPDADVSELRERLAAKHGVAPDQVLVTAGSTSFLHVLSHSLLAPGLNAITSERSFIVYPIAVQAAGGRLITVAMRNHGFDLDAIRERIDDNTRVIFLCNPNNPTGTLLTPEEIERFLDEVPDHLLVVLDEAYAEFAEAFAARRGVQYSRSIEYVRQGRNVVVLRTFSKAQGLAGVRVGYGIASPELINYFARVNIVFSVSSLAQAAALAALNDTEHIRKTLDNNCAGAEWLRKELKDVGFDSLPTWANFLYVDVGEDCVAVAKRMQAEGVIVRPLRGWGAPTAFRVTIGTPEENQAFIRAIKRVSAGTVAR